ncbi:MAG: hypothetical protein R3C60_02855 [Parvularculaceae bacterium]
MKTSRAFFSLLAALAVTGALASCATPGAPPPTTSRAAQGDYFATLEAAPATALASEADYRAVFAALEGVGAAKAASFKPEGAGAVARGVTLTFGAKHLAGLKIAELRLYGVDAASLGEDGAAEKKLASRIDMKGVQSFGLEKLMADFTAGYVRALAEAADKTGAEKEKALLKNDLAGLGSVETYAISAARLVADNLTIYPVGAAADSAEKPEGLAGAFKLYAEAARAVSADGFLSRDMKIDFVYGEGGAQKMKMALDYAAYRGLKRGDFDEAVSKGLTFEMAAPKRGETPALDMAGGVDLYRISDVRLAKLFDYWSRGETPPAREKNLLSLGVWRAEGERYSLNGLPFYSVKSAVTDLTKFEWLMPTSVSMSVDHFVYDIGALMEFASEASAVAKGDAPQPDMAAMIDNLKRYGLARYDVSYTADYLWAPATGASSVIVDSTIDGIGDLKFNLGAAMPAMRTLAAYQDKKTGEVDFEGMLLEFAGAKLTGFTSSLKDEGVIDKGFAMAAAAQAQKAGVDPDKVDPNTLRSAAALAMRAGAASSPAPMLITAFADFLGKGGVLDFVAKPKKPVPFGELAKKGAKGESPIERLGLAATQRSE